MRDLDESVSSPITPIAISRHSCAIAIPRYPPTTHAADYFSAKHMRTQVIRWMPIQLDLVLRLPLPILTRKAAPLRQTACNIRAAGLASAGYVVALQNGRVFDEKTR